MTPNFFAIQPTNGQVDISFFPNRIIGNYHNYETNADLIIQKELILSKQYFTDTLPQQKVLKLKEEMNVSSVKLNDTLYVTNYTINDTLFNMQQGSILRKLKGYYFLNVLNEDQNWNVTKLKFKNNIVSLNNIVTEEEIQTLEVLTETYVDTLRPATFTLTKKQFRKFVAQNGFTEGRIYIKKK